MVENIADNSVEHSEQFKHTPCIEQVTRVAGNYFNSLDEIKEVLVDYGTANMVDGDLGICWTSLKDLHKQAPEKNTENDRVRANMILSSRESQKSDIPAYVDAMIKVAAETLDKEKKFKLHIDYDGAKANFFKTLLSIDKVGQGYCFSIRNNIWESEQFTQILHEKYNAEAVYPNFISQDPKEVFLTLPEDPKNPGECRFDLASFFESLKQDFDLKTEWKEYEESLKNKCCFAIQTNGEIQFVMDVTGLKDLKMDENGILSGKMYSDKDTTEEEKKNYGDWKYRTKNTEKSINTGAYVSMKDRWKLLPTIQIRLRHFNPNEEYSKKLIQDPIVKEQLDTAAIKVSSFFGEKYSLPVKNKIVQGHTSGDYKHIKTLDLENKTMTLSED